MGSFAAGAGTSYLLSSTTPVPSGTANGVLYLNGSKVVTSGSGLTFDGANFKVTVPTGTPNTDGFSIKLQDVGGSANDVGFGVDGSGNLWQNVAASGPGFISYIGGSEQMRLTSTGLGIGTSSPGAKLDVNGQMFTRSANQFFSGTTRYGYQATTFLATGAGSNTDYLIVADTALKFGVGGSATPVATLDSSGNLGLGVTPSAWATVLPVLQANNASFTGYNNQAILSSNWYYNAGNKYITAGYATQYSQSSGQHVWYTAPSGTAGNAISFTQVMTLDASGNLGIGTTSPGYRLDVSQTPSSRDTEAVRFLSNYSGVGIQRVLSIASAANSDNAGPYVSFQTQAFAELLRIGVIRRAESSNAWGFEIMNTSNTRLFRVDANNNTVVGSAALATTATDGFLYVPTCAGTPTGTPTTFTGMAPIVVNTTNNKLYFYSGGQWRDAGP